MAEKQNGCQPQFAPYAFAQAAQCKHKNLLRSPIVDCNNNILYVSEN